MTDHLATYKSTLAIWQAKVVGSKPTAEVFAKVHGLGLRPGKQALACAMSLRPDEGVTGKQIIQVMSWYNTANDLPFDGKPQLNRMRGLVEAGAFKRANKAGVYQNTVTLLGESKIKQWAKVLADNTVSPKPVTKVAKVSRKANKVGVAAVTAALVAPAPAPDPLALPAELQR